MNQVIALSGNQRTTPPFAAEASHRIANHLAIVVGTIQTQIAQLQRGPGLLPRSHVGDMLRETAGRIVSLAQLHRHLAEQPQSGMIDIGSFLIEIISELGTTLSFGEKLGVRQRLGTNCLASAEQARTLGLIVVEIVMNSVKHAHPAGLTTDIAIACTTTANGALALEICDDGVGLPEGFDAAKDGGTGFRLIRTLARSIQAELQIESNDLGLCFHLVVPAPSASIDRLARP